MGAEADFLHFMLYASLKGIKKGTLLKSNLTIRISECSNNNTKAKKFIIKYMFYRVGINPIVFYFPPVRGYVRIGLYMYAYAFDLYRKPVYW